MKTEKKGYKELGLKYHPILNKNLDDLIKRVQNNKASLILVDGTIGEGKTTLGVHIADYINEKHGFPPIEFEEQLALGGEQFQEKLRTCYDKKLPCIVYDEAGDFNRRGSLTRFNMLINRTFETFRAFRIIPILCLPLFSVLDSDLFNKGIPRLLLHVRDRGKTSGKFWGYSTYRMYYLRSKIEKLIVKPMAFGHTDPNFYGNFSNLDPKRAENLDKFSTKGKLQILEKSEIEQKNLLNSREICQKLGIDKGKLSLFTRKYKILPEKIVKKRHFWSQKQADLLADFMNLRDRRL